jgi:hypothetical protein
MASGNRVEELETHVRELEATVTGLTDELLECKQRLGELEDQDDSDGDTIGSEERNGNTSLSSSDKIDSNNTDEDESEENTDLESDEIIVA